MPEQTAAPVSPALPDDSIRFGLDDFRRMMEALPMCIILHDAQTKSILWANPSACQVLGFTLEELLPKLAGKVLLEGQQPADLTIFPQKGAEPATAPPSERVPAGKN